MTTKFCPACEKDLPLEDFVRDKTKACGLKSACRPCHARRSTPTPKQPTRKRTGVARTQRDCKPWSSYGITEEEYDFLAAAQGGSCAVCQGPPKGGRYPRLVVDHDHVTGRVRGLLCADCNKALGLLRDAPNVMRSAAEYVEGTLCPWFSSTIRYSEQPFR